MPFAGQREIDCIARWSRADGSGCILWHGCQTGTGYGAMSFGRGARKAHRVALAIHLGTDIDTKTHVLHSCHNPLCVNPIHLRYGTDKENAVDKVRAGRNKDRRFSDEAADQIKALKGYVAARELAEVLGVKKPTIVAIMANKVYRDRVDVME